jgi:glycosyltransferase involved in cell wall biosynthesis
MVSCVLCTYGRHSTVRKSLAMFLAQTWPHKELVIFNTAETPLVLGHFPGSSQVNLVNQSTKANGDPFTSLGDVRNAALIHADGELFVCWDDDDMFLPHHLEQSVMAWTSAGTMAWKPKKSFFSMDGGQTFKHAQNSMEASILVDMDFVREFGFSTTQSGGEHVQGGWLDKAKQQNQLTVEDVTPRESYGYVWGDGLSKTSGNIDDPNNFENHKAASQDFGDGVPLLPVPLTSLLPLFLAAERVSETHTF